jgi:hypothetical protein
MDTAGAELADDPGPLRLRSCPACEYSLEGMPAQGTCPECGRAYDQACIVLTGRGRGKHDTLAGGTWRGTAGSGAALLIVLVVVLMTRRTLVRSWWIAWVIVGLLTMGLQLFARLFSDREPSMQLWLTPSGVAQVGSTAEVRQAHRLANLAGWLVVPLALTATLFASRMRLDLAILLFAWGLAAMFSWSQLRALLWKPPQDAKHGPGVTFGLWPWSNVHEWTIKWLANGQVRVRMVIARMWARIEISREPVVDIELELTTAQVDALARRMTSWTAAAKGTAK